MSECLHLAMSDQGTEMIGAHTAEAVEVMSIERIDHHHSLIEMEENAIVIGISCPNCQLKSCLTFCLIA